MSNTFGFLNVTNVSEQKFDLSPWIEDGWIHIASVNLVNEHAIFYKCFDAGITQAVNKNRSFRAI